MKTLSTILFFLFMSQNIFATEFYLTHESRGILFGNNIFSIAEIDTDRIHHLKRSGKSLDLESAGSYSHNSGIGVRFKQGFDVGLFYSELWNSSEKIDPDHFQGTMPLHTSGWNFRQRSKVGTATALGSATNDYYFWNIDIESGYSIKLPSAPNLPDVILRIMVGLRYAEFNQNMNMIRNNSDGGLSFPSGERIFRLQRIVDVNIKGMGPRFGASLTFPVGDFNLIVGGNYSILFSQRELADDFFVDNGNHTWFNDDGSNENNKDMTIHNFDLNGGIQYNYKINEESSLIFELGYRYAAFDKARTNCGRLSVHLADGEKKSFYGECKTNKFFKGTNRQSHDHLSEDFISHGPYLKVGYKF